MTIRLPEDVEAAIDAAVRDGHFASAADMIASLVQEYGRRPRPSPEASPATVPTPEAERPIWEESLERAADVPPEEWARLPTDLAGQHDHYIYGTPKRPTS